MALPTILVDSATGTASTASPPASGAGPATAIGGSKARTRNAASQSRIGFFESSAPDLSGVAVDSTHVLFAETSSGRRFSKITGKKDTSQSVTGDMTSGSPTLSNTNTTGWTAGDVIRVAGAAAAGADLYTTIAAGGVVDGTTATLSDNAGSNVTGAAVVNPKQVTVGNAVFQITSDIDWAIGGKLSAVWADSGYKRLCDDAGTSGDIEAGWTVEFATGHAETLAGTYFIRVAGSNTVGPIIFRAASGYSTRPAFTNTGSGTHGFSLSNYNHLVGLEAIHANAGTTFYGVNGAANCCIDDCEIRASSGSWARGAYIGSYCSVRLCEITTGNTYGVHIAGNGSSVIGNYISGVGDGIYVDGSIYGALIEANIINGATDDGIELAGQTYCTIQNNTIFSAADDGIVASSTAILGLVLRNNIVDGDSDTDVGIALPSIGYRSGWVIEGNNVYNCATNYNVSDISSTNTELDPAFVNQAAGDYTTGAAMLGVGWPTATLPGLTCRSYIDKGAIQRTGRASGLGLTAANTRYGVAIDDVTGDLQIPNSGTPTGTQDATSDACVVSGKKYGSPERTGSAEAGGGTGIWMPRPRQVGM